jgi:ribosome recycling factor
MLIRQILQAGEEPMKKTIEKMKNDFSGIRTGRASLSLVEGIKVESYGSLMPLNQLAGMNLPDGRTIEIRPWDISQISNIEKAIQKSELGLTPANDGKTIRLNLPSLTEERRRDILKIVHKMAEEFKVAIRNERRQIVEHIKKAEKDKLISEDDRKKAETESQKLTDLYIHKIEEATAHKEKDVMEV